MHTYAHKAYSSTVTQTQDAIKGLNVRVVAGSSQLFHSGLWLNGSLPSIAALENFIFHFALLVVATYLQPGVSAQMSKAMARSTTHRPGTFVISGHRTASPSLVSRQGSAKATGKIR